MSSEPIDLEIVQGKVELSGYRDDATLGDLRSAVEAARSDDSLVTSHCAGCGRCCHYEHLPLFGLDIAEMEFRLGSDTARAAMAFPPKPSIDERRAGIAGFERQHGLDRITSTLLYEFNVAEPISYAKNSLGSCAYVRNGFCGNYEHRAYTCALYACTAGDRLSTLQEMIVRQGVWHSYYRIGWISGEEIGHNPFLGADGYDSVPIRSFDVDLSGALEALFFYY